MVLVPGGLGDEGLAMIKEMGRDSWPVEDSEKMPDRSRCREHRPMHNILREMAKMNAKLMEVKQPVLIQEEVIAARLYTGHVVVSWIHLTVSLVTAFTSHVREVRTGGHR